MPDVTKDKPGTTLKQLLKLSKLVLAESKVNSVLELSMDHAIEITGAERGMIILFDSQDEILFETARNLAKQDIENPKFQISRTIINNVKANSQAIHLQNALEDSGFEDSDSVDELKILSVICLPLKYEDKIFGVVYLDNRTVEGAFKPELYDFAREFADFISLASYNALTKRRMQNQQQALEKELRSQYDFDVIVGNAKALIDVLDLVSQVAETDAQVLIEGESGTGKELVARAIHHNSSRRRLPLLCINCGAIPDNLLESELFGHEKGAFTGAFKRYRGKFEQADGGTIFLDEVNEMSPSLQVKLLRILQWGEFSPLGSEETKQCDVRIVAASKIPLHTLVQQGIFRDDLYYRLKLITINVPPLRERKEDIMLLASYFLQKACKDFSKSASAIDSAAQALLQQYDYPGNVRELENIIKRAVILCNGDTIEIKHLPPELRNPHIVDVAGQAEIFQNFQEAKQHVVENFERRYIEAILQECDGVIRKAAQRSGMFEGNFHAKLKKYGISARNLKSQKH